MLVKASRDVGCSCVSARPLLRGAPRERRMDAAERTMDLQADRARRWRPALTLASVLMLAACSRVTGLIPGSAQEVATPDLSDAQRIALVRGRTTPACHFVHGFADARSAVPEVIGDCLENERADPASGDTVQRTTRGLLVWRKADGLVAFTDGHRTWVRGPDGL